VGLDACWGMLALHLSPPAERVICSIRQKHRTGARLSGKSSTQMFLDQSQLWHHLCKHSLCTT